MEVSFVIPTWNTANITLKSVRSINKYIPSPEIIIVDNNSDDNTINILSKIENVKIIKNENNLGFSKANNIGFKKTSSDYIIFMNSDVELIDNSVLEMIDYLKKKQNIGLIGPKFLNPNLTPQASVFPLQTKFNAFKEFWLGQKESYSKYIPKSNRPIKVDYISGGFIVINRYFFQKIGLWNEKYFFYFEDLDLCRKVKENGKDVIYYPKCKIIHRHGASGANLTDFKDQWKRLVPSSKVFHGLINHYLINSIIWSGQKWQRIKKHF